MTRRIWRPLLLVVALAAAAVACDRVVDLTDVPPDSHVGPDAHIFPDGTPFPDAGIDAHPLPDAASLD